MTPSVQYHEPMIFTFCVSVSEIDGIPAMGDGDAAYVDVLQKEMNGYTGFQISASRLLDHLYIGGEEVARDLNFLRSSGIYHVVNCASGYANTGPDFYGKDFSYMGFDAQDDSSYDIMQHFQQVYDFIEKARLSGGKVLIHCLVGVNRSGVLAVAYCMLHKNLGPISAARFVKGSRKMVLTNDGFQRRLVAFARERGMLQLDKHLLDTM
ncbi:Dual specificity protein phosphatase 26 [Lamellibrachia satsuma]|nr:Dual specificity protein phosphatase 26 [Lamellibrachia satsuma]